MTALVSIEQVRDGTKCVFLLPKHYTVPSLLSKASPHDCSIAFSIADRVIATNLQVCEEERKESFIHL